MIKLFFTTFVVFFLYHLNSIAVDDIQAVKEKMTGMLADDYASAKSGTQQQPMTIDPRMSMPKRVKVDIPQGAVTLEAGKVPKNGASADFFVDYAYRAFISGNVEAALMYYKSALEKDPKNEHAMFGVGASYQFLGQNDEAIKAYTELLNIDGNHLQASNNLMVLISGNSPKDAIKELQKISKSHPNNAFILAQIGTIHASLDENDDAILNLGKAVEIDPSNPLYTYNMAIILDKLKKYHDAYTYYKHTLELIIPSTPLDKEAIKDRMMYIRYKD